MAFGRGQAGKPNVRLAADDPHQLLARVWKKGSGTKSAKHPKGRLRLLVPDPFFHEYAPLCGRGISLQSAAIAVKKRGRSSDVIDFEPTSSSGTNPEVGS